MAYWRDLWKHLRWPSIYTLAHGVVSLGFLAILGAGESVAHWALPGDPVIPVLGYTVSEWFLFLDVSFASAVIGVGVVRAIWALLRS